jgi:hypothetical protein
VCLLVRHCVVWLVHVCERVYVCSLGTREYLPNSQSKKFLGLGCTQVDLELLVRPDSLVAIGFQIVALL